MCCRLIDFSVMLHSPNDPDKFVINLGVFKNFFENLNRNPHNNHVTSILNSQLIANSYTSENKDINMPFTVQEVTAAIKRLKNNKSAGIDGILNEFLKHWLKDMYIAITQLFNIALNTGIVPTDWCISLICPIYKNKGQRNDPDNYRGITLLSCIGKLFTSCLNHRLCSYIECQQIIGNEQAGFRSGHSTIDHIFALHTLIDLYLNKKKKLYCALIDYKKAFDCVDRTLLWQRTLESNVNGKLFRVIYNMYDAAKSCIKVGNNLSKVLHCNIGVRQGENLSPILFAMLINEFKNNLSTQYSGVHLNQLYNTDIELQLKLFTLLYADDTIVLAETERELQSALDAVHEYCNNMHLTVNTQKTKVMIFSRGKVRKYQNFMFGGSILYVTYEYVYLGVNFNYNTSFIKAIERHISRAKRAMFVIVTKSRRLSLPLDILFELFDRVVLPVVLYASEIYGHSDSCIKKLEIFQRSLYKTTNIVHDIICSYCI